MTDNKIAAGAEELITHAEIMSERDPQIAIAMLFTAAASMARGMGMDEAKYREGTELAWRLTTSPR